ncbi:MAG: TlpA family protein disulfide reductase, partial [Nitrososphaerales archaeon]
IIKEFDFQPAQAIYELYFRLHGEMKKDILMQALARYHTDTLQLSKTPIKHMVFLLVGTNTKGERVIITDANNNLDFSDDRVYEYDTSSDKEIMKKIENSLPNEVVHFQYYYNRKIYNKTFNFKISPIHSGWNYSDPIQEKLYLLCILNEYHEGRFSFNNQKYKIQVATYKPPWFVFDSLNTKIKLSQDRNVDQKKNKKSDNYYLIGDTISLNDFKYRITNISIFGDTLNLDYMGKGPVIYGIDSGKIAYNIKSTDLSNNKFDLDDYRGKYVLIDFWGTWCRPCINSIPDLVSISKNFKDDVQLVSIADDYPQNMSTLREMIKNKGMNWIHIFQDMSNPSRELIIKQYKVTTFPTQILISPEGKIISRTTGGDKGQQLTEKLNALLHSGQN